MSAPGATWSALDVFVQVSLPPEPTGRQKVTGEACSTVPGLAITYAGDERWAVTHLDSGLAVAEAGTKELAREVLLGLDAVDWTRSDALLRLDAAVPLAIGRALARAEALLPARTRWERLEAASPAQAPLEPPQAQMGAER